MTEAERAALARTLMGYGLGPTTERTRAGLPNAEARAATPSVGEDAAFAARQAIGGTTGERLAPLAQALLDYGPMPAKAVVGQAERAGAAAADAVQDPSVSNIANAGIQGGAALAPFAPAIAGPVVAGSAAVGFGDAARRDLGMFLSSPAEAQQRGKKAPPAPGSEGEYRDAEDRLARSAFRTNDERRSLLKIRDDYRAKLGKDADRMGDVDRQKKLDEQAEYNRRVGLAEALRDKELGTARRFADTEVGKFYDKTGGFAPLAASLAAGGAYRLMKGPAAQGEVLAPFKYGTGAAFATATAPSAYDWLNNPVVDPKLSAAEVYADELPAGHPRKGEAVETAGRMRTQNPSGLNPTRERAFEETMDPVNIGKRLLFSGIEGTMAPLGAGVVGAGTRIGRDIYRDGLFQSRLRPPPVPAAAPPSPPAPAGPSGSGLSLSAGVPPGPGTGAGQTHPPHPLPSPPGPQPTPVRNPRPSPAPSQSSYDANVHSPIARGVIDDYLAAGTIPADAAELRAAVVRAIEAAGAPMPARRALTNKSADTLGLVHALQGAPESTRSAVLDATLGRGRFLAVPAAAGIGASMSVDADPQALASALLAYDAPGAARNAYPPAGAGPQALARALLAQ